MRILLSLLASRSSLLDASHVCCKSICKTIWMIRRRLILSLVSHLLLLTSVCESVVGCIHCNSQRVYPAQSWTPLLLLLLEQRVLILLLIRRNIPQLNQERTPISILLDTGSLCLHKLLRNSMYRTSSTMRYRPCIKWRNNISWYYQ